MEYNGMNRRSLLKLLLALPGMTPAAVAKPRVDKALTLLTTQLAGFQYYAGEKLWQSLTAGDDLKLFRELGNPHDKRAVALFWKGYKIGYIPRRDNAVIAQLLDNNTPLQTQIIRLEEDDNPWRRICFRVNLAV
jgi:hypothetical protein